MLCVAAERTYLCELDEIFLLQTTRCRGRGEASTASARTRSQQLLIARTARTTEIAFLEHRRRYWLQLSTQNPNKWAQRKARMRSYAAARQELKKQIEQQQQQAEEEDDSEDEDSEDDYDG